MNLYVVRHGQTDWNTKKLLQGSSDIDLNSVGLEQAKKLADTLKDVNIDYIFCSPLKRAIKTAEFVKKDKNVPSILEPRIIERSFGELEGTTPNNISKYWNYYEDITNHNVESIHNLINRVFNFMDELKEKHKNDDILIVTHQGVMIIIDCYINGFKENHSFDNYNFDNGTYTKYVI